MPPIQALVDEHLEDRRDTNMLDVTVLVAQAVRATRYYHGYGNLSAYPADQEPGIDAQTVVSDSEWSVIRPLFELYAEREVSVQIEASRMMGVDVFGRMSSEIMQDIRTVESEMPEKAFAGDIVTI